MPSTLWSVTGLTVISVSTTSSCPYLTLNAGAARILQIIAFASFPEKTRHGMFGHCARHPEWSSGNIRWFRPARFGWSSSGCSRHSSTRNRSRCPSSRRRRTLRSAGIRQSNNARCIWCSSMFRPSDKVRMSLPKWILRIPQILREHSLTKK